MYKYYTYTLIIYNVLTTHLYINIYYRWTGWRAGGQDARGQLHCVGHARGHAAEGERSVMEVGIHIYLYYSAYDVHTMYSYHSLIYYYCILHMCIICLLMMHVYRCGAAVSMCSRCRWSSTTTSPPTASCIYTASAARVGPLRAQGRRDQLRQG